MFGVRYVVKGMFLPKNVEIVEIVEFVCVFNVSFISFNVSLLRLPETLQHILVSTKQERQSHFI